MFAAWPACYGFVCAHLSWSRIDNHLMNIKHCSVKRSLWRFLLPSLLGVLSLMVPFTYQDHYGTLLVHFTAWLGGNCQLALAWLVVIGFLVGFCFGLLGYCYSAPWMLRWSWLCARCKVRPIWLLVRLLGVLFGLCALLHIGEEWFWSSAQDIFVGAMPLFVINLLLGSLLMPLLLEFGLMEFLGAFLGPFMRTCFKLPGYAAVHCMALWFGDGIVGALMVLDAYAKGHYGRRSTAILITCFASVSISFYAVILQKLGLEDYWGAFCFTTFLSGLVAAWILPRIPPLLNKEETSLGNGFLVEDIAPSRSLWQQSFGMATQRAAKAPSLFLLLRKSLAGAVDFMGSVLPSVAVMGTMGLVLAHSDFFAWLGLPFRFLFDLAGLAEGDKASQSIAAGFIDMFLTVMLGGKIVAPLTRFVVGALSVTQVIYLAEHGVILLRERSLGINWCDLLVIFLLRILITLPIICGCAYCFIS